MLPSRRPAIGIPAEAADMSSAVSVRLTVLKKRSDFLRLSRAKRYATPAFVLQLQHNEDADDARKPNTMRVGYTCSKKVGNAVRRNRAKRRLRAMARLVLPRHGRPGWDYVLIGRANTTANNSFQEMCDDLRRILVQERGPAQ